MSLNPELDVLDEGDNQQTDTATGDTQQDDHSDTDQQDSIIKREKRVITLSEKGKELFETNRRAFQLKLSVIHNDIQLLSRNIEVHSNNLKSLEELKDEFVHTTSKYDHMCREYLNFLARTNTAQCIEEAANVSAEISDFTRKVETDLKRMNEYINELRQQTGSGKNLTRSSKSKTSTASSAVAKVKAKAEAAKVRAEFAEKEAQLLKEKALLEEKQAIETAKAERRKADLEADLDLLNFKKEAAAVEAEAEALQSEFDESMSQVLSDKPPLDAKIRTASFISHVQQQNREIEDMSRSAVNNMNSNTPAPPELNPHASEFVPQINSHRDHHVQYESSTNYRENTNHEITNYGEKGMAADFTRFLLKRDLLMSRFKIFNDKPEFYPSWKDSFRKIISEIQANPTEEMDLLVKWTGPQSQTHVQSIKSSNTNNPSRALKLIWERLDERFGSPELIDSALKRKLAAFPRITERDFSKLYDLSDILSEISSVKENEDYGLLFSYFDSSIGVSPIVAKLPHQLQERWTRTAVNYNSRHKTIYPPFHVFAQFIHEESRVKNNPSYLYETPSNLMHAKEKPAGKARTLDVRVRKVESTETITKADSFSIDPSIKCPIHGSRN